MVYRTKTYIAGDWDGDKNLIEQLRKWNNSNYWGLSFVDAHDLTSARDSSLYCSIKKSLRTRLDASKTFVLIVGSMTDSVTSGSCRHCSSYSSFYGRCNKGYTVDHRSYIKYEYDYAVKHDLKIVVIYNYADVHRDKCPEVVRYRGTHVASYYRVSDGNYYWDYQAVKKAIEE